MLILQRDVSQVVRIVVPPSDKPTTVDVMLTEVRSRRSAKIGFDAPNSVDVHRLEVWELIQKEGERGESED